MKLVRILSDAPADPAIAADLICYLESCGFTVQLAQDSAPNSPAADIEIDLRVVSLETALSIARDLTQEDVEVFLFPGIYEDAPAEAAAELAMPQEAMLEEAVSPEAMPELAMHEEAVPELAVPDEAVLEKAVPELVELPELAAPELAVPELAMYEEMVPEAVQSSDVEPEEQEQAPAHQPEPVYQETAQPAELKKQSRYDIVLPRLRESAAQTWTEAAMTFRECLALAMAELLSFSEHSRERLTQMRVALVRKRALVEMRAARMRMLFEDRLHLDTGGGTGWIRSAFAGAALMIILLSIAVWRQQHPGAAVSASAGAETTAKAPSTQIQATVIDSAPAPRTTTTALHHRMPPVRTDIAEGDSEVIIRHFRRPDPKPALARTSSGVKHISDMN